MRTVNALVLAAGLVLLAASPARALPPPSPYEFGGMKDPKCAVLLRDAKVQEELKLTDEQNADVKKLADKYDGDIQKAAENKDAKKVQELMAAAGADADKALKPEQAKRFDQIKLQASGLYALRRADVAAALKLSDDQRKEVGYRSTMLESQTARMLLDAESDPDKRADALKTACALCQDGLDQVLGGLSDEQKKTWKGLTGEKFEPAEQPH